MYLPPRKNLRFISEDENGIRYSDGSYLWVCAKQDFKLNPAVWDDLTLKCGEWVCCGIDDSICPFKW